MRIFLFLLTACLAGCQIPLSPPRSPELAPEIRHPLPPTDDQVVGRLGRLRLRSGDTLADVARHFGIGFQAIRDANPGVDPWLPTPGTEILLPLAFILPDATHQGIVINLAAMRLFYFPAPHSSRVWSYAVGIGRDSWNTPLGRTRIIEKKTNPRWVVPASIRQEHARKGDPLPKVVPPGPDNPLGRHALRLGWSSYLIHGTNKPYGVGLRVSHGCIRLYPEDIAELFPQIDVGTPVTVVNQPYLAGWRDGQVFVQIYRPLDQKGATLKKLWHDLEKRLKAYESRTGKPIDWQRVERAVADARGIPLPVLQSSPPWNRYLAQVPRIPHPGTWPGKFVPPPPRPGWYVKVEMPLTETTAEKLVAMLHHQGPPLPAHRIGDRILIGPYPDERQAKRTETRLARDLELTGRLLSPRQSQRLFRSLIATQ